VFELYTPWKSPDEAAHSRSVFSLDPAHHRLDLVASAAFGGAEPAVHGRREGAFALETQFDVRGHYTQGVSGLEKGVVHPATEGGVRW